MSLVHDRCVCLQKTEYSETSQILTLLGRAHGIVRVIAKGAHRRTRAGASRFSGGIDVLETGDAVFTHASDRELGTLCEWRLCDGHLPLRKNLRALYLGLYAAELTSSFFEQHDPHPDVFDRLETLLGELTTPRIEQAFLAFELELLKDAGFLPQLQACTGCGREMTDRAYFSPAAGGLVCRNCESTRPDRLEIDVRLVRLLQGVLRSPQRLPQLTRHQTDPVNRLLIKHIEYTLSRRLRLAAYVV